MDSVQSNSIGDIFDSLLNLEDTHLKEGFNEGYEAGLVLGREDARQLGLKIGFQTGELLGFYKGCVDVWNSAIVDDPTRFSTLFQKHIKEFQELTERYPLMDPGNGNVDKMKDDLRVKFSVICASLGVLKKKLEYKGYPNVSDEFEF